MLLRQLGADILAYDLAPPGGERDNPQARRLWTTVRQGNPSVLRRVSPRRALFLCWPPYSTNMASRALDHYQGDTVAYIGESWGGCTGDDGFHRKLAREWREDDELRAPIPSWDGIHDTLTIYRRG